MDDVIIAGDLNESANSNDIKKFFTEIGVEDVHSRINNIPLKEMDKTYINGSNSIDTIAVSEGIMEYVEGVKLIAHNEIVTMDHRAYVVDINMEEYFSDEFSQWDAINHAMLDPARKSYRIKFVEELENQLDRHQIENLIENFQNPSHQQIEYFDEIIISILNKATKKVEGQRQNIPYSKAKAKCQGEIKFWKLKVRQAKGISIDEDEISKLKELYEISQNEGEGREHYINQLKKAKENWNKMKEKGREHREKELLDLYPNELTEEQLTNEHQKKKILRSIRKISNENMHSNI